MVTELSADDHEEALEKEKGEDAMSKLHWEESLAAAQAAAKERDAPLMIDFWDPA